MVSSVNKWLFIPLLAALLLSARPVTPHPFHVSVVEIEHNAIAKTLEISCKIFTDDFEAVLAKNYKTKVDLVNSPNKSEMDTLVKKYLLSHLSLKAGGKELVLNYLGFENENEAAYGYIEAENAVSVNKLEITNSILFDKFDDQVNIIHVKVGGSRKSTKLNYPDTRAAFSY
jgi:hypothetical protein